MKRILLVSPFPPYIGGVSVSVQRLSEQLIKDGYYVDKFNTQTWNKRFNNKVIKFLKYLGLPLFLAFSRRYDVIHFHVSKIVPKLYVSLWRQLFSRETKFILTIHGYAGNAFRSKRGHLALRGFDRIICVKQGDRENMPSDYLMKTAEIPAFIPPVIEDNDALKFPRDLELFLNRDSFRMLINGFVITKGNYNDLYGLRDAVILLEKLRKMGRNADLIIIVLGSDSEIFVRDLKTYIKSADLEGNILWMEGANGELWPLLKRVNVLLRPTKTDGDAMSVREALYLKVPVITSDVVPRPDGSVVYKSGSQQDILDKTIWLIDNYDSHVASIIARNTGENFAKKIIQQYESN